MYTNDTYTYEKLGTLFVEDYHYDYSDLSHGKYSCQMANYVYNSILCGGDYGDDEIGSDMLGEGEGMHRYGKRILGYDNQGFVYLHKYPTVAKAMEVMELTRIDANATLDDECKNLGCTACPYCASLDCAGCVDIPGKVDSGSSHVVGCSRDWIG